MNSPLYYVVNTKHCVSNCVENFHDFTFLLSGSSSHILSVIISSLIRVISSYQIQNVKWR